MPFKSAWVKGFEKDLARYCIPELPAGWKLDLNPTACLGSPAGHQKLAGAIYDKLASLNIQYAPALYHWEEKSQKIRTSDEILCPPNQGTCLDLSLLFAGLCLANQLLPLIIVLEGHAYAAVCLTQSATDKSLFGRVGENVFGEGGGLALSRDKEALEKLLEEGDFLPVECTGFAHLENPKPKLPEETGRTNGLFDFDKAVKVARQHFSGSRNVLFALDVEWMQRAIGGGIVDGGASASLLKTRVPEEQLRQLLEILARVTPASPNEEFFRVYRATLPPSARPLNSNDPARLAADLCDLPVMTGKTWPPLIEFVERLVLAKRIKLADAAELQKWVDAGASLVAPPTPTSEIKRLRQELRAEKVRAASPDAVSCLQVYLEPASLNRTEERKQPQFAIELVLWSPLMDHALTLESNRPEDSGKEKRLWTLDELPSLLDEVLARPHTVSLIPEILRLVIEIVAPSDVLLYGFERWKRKNSTYTYGVDYPLVVRLRDRMVFPSTEDQKRADEFWHRKWNVFRNSMFSQGCEELTWYKQEDLDVLELQDDSDLVCLGLSSPLLPEKREVFDVLRDAGIPIAIWLRGGDLEATPLADWPQRVRDLIQGKPLADLRHAVQAVRRSKDARKDEKHFGNSLTLLWDEPDRLPLKYGEQGVFV